MRSWRRPATPEEREALKEFSDALGALRDDWNKFHDDYDELQKDARRMGPDSVLDRLDRLVSQFEGIVDAAGELPSADATEDIARALKKAAEAELDALFAVNDALLARDPPGFPDAGAPQPPPSAAGPPLDLMDAAIEESEDVLRDTRRLTKDLVDDDPQEKLAEVKEFADGYKDLLAEWDAFHQRYNDWRKTDGGCDRDGGAPVAGRVQPAHGRAWPQGPGASPVQLPAANVQPAGRGGHKGGGGHTRSPELLAALYR